jgi:hypothetical protein
MRAMDDLGQDVFGVMIPSRSFLQFGHKLLNPVEHQRVMGVGQFWIFGTRARS